MSQTTGGSTGDAFRPAISGNRAGTSLSRHFLLATSINFLPAALGGEKLELVLIGVLRVVFINRIRIARTYAATQRARDLERFEALRREQEQAPDSPQPHTNKVI